MTEVQQVKQIPLTQAELKKLKALLERLVATESFGSLFGFTSMHDHLYRLIASIERKLQK